MVLIAIDRGIVAVTPSALLCSAMLEAPEIAGAGSGRVNKQCDPGLEDPTPYTTTSDPVSSSSSSFLLSPRNAAPDPVSSHWAPPLLVSPSHANRFIVLPGAAVGILTLPLAGSPSELKVAERPPQNPFYLHCRQQ